MSDTVTTDPASRNIDREHTGLYLVRFGYQRDVVPIQTGLVPLTRGDEIVCRTSRGIEMGAVLAAVPPDHLPAVSPGKFIRRCRPEDQLLGQQLRALSGDASLACQQYLQERGASDILIEVEPLIDGRTLYFHFLGDPSEATERHIQELSDVYQKKVAASRFAELLEHGCGPGCGTKEKSGCGTNGGCAVCAIAGGCTAK